jgi:hypothetical protein
MSFSPTKGMIGGAVLMSLNPASPLNYVIFGIIVYLIATKAIKKKDGSFQWKKAMMYGIFPYLLLSIPLNMYLVPRYLPFLM